MHIFKLFLFYLLLYRIGIFTYFIFETAERYLNSILSQLTELGFIHYQCCGSEFKSLM